MINLSEKNEILMQFTEGSTQMFESVRERYDLRSAMEDCNVSEVRNIVKNIQNIMIANIPDGVSVPKVTMYTTASGAEGISLVNIKVTNGLNSEKKFSYAVSITRDRASDKAFDFLLSVYKVLIVDELVSINLERVNDVLLQIVAESGIDYGVRIVSSLGNEGKKIASISDDEITFVADEDRVFDLENIIVLFESPTDVITEDVIQSHYQKLVEEIMTAQTPVQLVGIHGGVLIAHVCNISNRLKPMTLIKKVCSKNVFKLNSDKDTIAYYAKDDVFALLSKRDGNFEVILTPFDVNTLCNVDLDILSDIS